MKRRGQLSSRERRANEKNVFDSQPLGEDERWKSEKNQNALGTRIVYSPPPPLHGQRAQAPKARERAVFSSTDEFEGLPKLPSFGEREHGVHLQVRFYIAHEAVLRRR